MTVTGLRNGGSYAALEFPVGLVLLTGTGIGTLTSPVVLVGRAPVKEEA
ncbi:MAG: hypothetical protein ACR2LI_01525 [Propionibacteriaceae bacterium]